MRKSPLLAGLLWALLPLTGAAAGKKVPVKPPTMSAQPPPPPAVEELKPAPAPPPVAPVEVAPAPVAAPAKEELPPVSSVRSGLLLQVAGGAVIPFSVLGVGGRGEVRASWLFAKVPLGLSLSFGFEQHTAQTAAFITPPAGGFEPVGLDNQTLFPAQVLAHVLLLRDEHNRLQLGAGYALLIAWTQAQALGKTRDESGLGHEVGAELAYSRRFGSIELEVRARYSVRRTAVGPYTAAMELPWYQAAGLLIGLGLWP
jgi:hypothetical protein